MLIMISSKIDVDDDDSDWRTASTASKDDELVRKPIG